LVARAGDVEFQLELAPARRGDPERSGGLLDPHPRVAGVECRQLHADFALHLHPAAAEFPEGSAETAEEVRDFLRAEQQEHRDDDQDDDPFDALDRGGHAPDVPRRHAGSPSDQGARSYEVFARARGFSMRTASTYPRTQIMRIG